MLWESKGILRKSCLAVRRNRRRRNERGDKDGAACLALLRSSGFLLDRERSILQPTLDDRIQISRRRSHEAASAIERVRADEHVLILQLLADVRKPSAKQWRRKTLLLQLHPERVVA